MQKLLTKEKHYHNEWLTSSMIICFCLYVYLLKYQGHFFNRWLTQFNSTLPHNSIEQVALKQYLHKMILIIKLERLKTRCSLERGQNGIFQQNSSFCFISSTYASWVRREPKYVRSRLIQESIRGWTLSRGGEGKWLSYLLLFYS